MEAGGLYVCSAGGKASNLPSFKSAAADQQKLTAHLLPELKLSEKPKPHFPEFTSLETYPPASLFLHFLVHFWAASRSSLPSLDHLRPGTELIHTHRRKGGGGMGRPLSGIVVAAHAQLKAAAARRWQLLSKAQKAAACCTRGYQKTPIFEIQRMPYLIPFLWS